MAEANGDDGLDYPGPTLADQISWVAGELKSLDDALEFDAKFFTDGVDAGIATEPFAKMVIKNADAIHWGLLGLRTLADGLPTGSQIVADLQAWPREALATWGNPVTEAEDDIGRGDFGAAVRTVHAACLGLRKVLRAQLTKLIADFYPHVAHAADLTKANRKSAEPVEPVELYGERLTYADRYAVELMRNPERAAWSDSEWARHLGCARQTVADIPLYKLIKQKRELPASNSISRFEKRSRPARRPDHKSDWHKGGMDDDDNVRRRYG